MTLDLPLLLYYSVYILSIAAGINEAMMGVAVEAQFLALHILFILQGFNEVGE